MVQYTACLNLIRLEVYIHHSVILCIIHVLIFIRGNTYCIIIFQVYCRERKKHSSILPPNVQVGVRLEVPIKFGVQIKGGEDANVHVRNLEGENYEITTENGNCHLTNIKGSAINIETSGGDIICDGPLLSTFGSLVTQGKGNISVSKLQGSKFYLETENGKIDAKAVYLERSEFCSQQGDVQLGDVHGELLFNPFSPKLIIQILPTIQEEND